MMAETERVYHPCSQRYGGVGLVKSGLAIKLSDLFVYDDAGNSNHSQPPSGIRWQGIVHPLEQQNNVSS